MPTDSHRALRIVLGLLAAITAGGGLLLVLAGKPLLSRMLFGPPESEMSTLLLVTIKEIGGTLVMLSLMLFFAYRDPVRNVAIIDALIGGLCVLVITPILSLYTTDVREMYPAYLIWARSLVRLALAALLFYLRPRPSPRPSLPL